MKRSSTLLGITFAIILCGTAFGVMSAPVAHAQSSAPAPGSGCKWYAIAANEYTFSSGNISGYKLYTNLFADYNTTTTLVCHHMFNEVQVYTPPNGFGTTLWAYLNNCSGDTILSASTNVNHGLNGAWTTVYTGSYTEDCGQAGGADYNNGNFMADVWTVTRHN